MPLEDIRQVTVSYESGESTALAGEGLWLVADTHPADTEIGLMWQRMVAGVPSGEIAEEILGLFSGGHFPRGFVLARLVGDAILVAVAGEGNLELRHGEFVERLTCPESAVIADYRIREIARRAHRRDQRRSRGRPGALLGRSGVGESAPRGVEPRADPGSRPLRGSRPRTRQSPRYRTGGARGGRHHPPFRKRRRSDTGRA